MAGSLRVGMVLQSMADPGGEAKHLEDLGLDYACSGEHVAFNVPVSNSFVSLAVAAGATSRIELMSTIVLAPLYPPALLAKLGAALQVASGGRYHLGVGVGGEIPAEFEACSVPRNERGARTNEALELARLLWSTPRAEYAGRFTTFRDVTISPRPSPPPPIWVSGRSEAAMTRTARFGDGWLPYMYTPEMLADSVTRIAERRELDQPVRPGLFIWGCVDDDGDLARRQAIDALSTTYAQDFSRLVGRYAFAGTPDEVVARLGEYADAGAETVVVSFACPRDRIAPVQELFAREVLPRLRG